jgi:hypothetical protein
MDLPYYVENINGVFYCFLENEMDKKSFEDQCNKCVLKDSCNSKKDIYKSVSGDWHSLNTSGLYGKEFDECNDKFKKKDLRNIGKIVGLALCYGGSNYTVSGNMNTNKEDAQNKIDSFFSKLSILNLYMIAAKNKVLEIGKVYNMFGRCRDVSKWAFSQNWKDKAYAQRTALNHPIQSTSAELLKIMMIRVDDHITLNNLSPLYGLSIPQKIDLNSISYKNFKLHEIMSTHDEVDYLFHEDYLDELIPIIYELMQLKDVLHAFDVGFDLELDCEFDKKNRSLVASTSYLNSKIYLINQLKQNQMGGIEKIEPNSIILEFKDIDQNFLDSLSYYTSKEENREYFLLIDSDSGVYFHENKFSLEFIKNLNVKIKLAYTN